ncbi:PHP domain-containing protein, partial [Staphylococcus auricularis]|uniref:hypothetical protein n=1 Tax=Staphylococcus auricularis TaxID=29379 RepID=UPI00384E05F3
MHTPYHLLHSTFPIKHLIPKPPTEPYTPLPLTHHNLFFPVPHFYHPSLHPNIHPILPITLTLTHHLPQLHTLLLPQHNTPLHH